MRDWTLLIEFKCLMNAFEIKIKNSMVPER